MALLNVESWCSEEETGIDVTIVRIYSKVMVFVNEEERLIRNFENDDEAKSYFGIQVELFEAHPEFYLNELG